MCFYCSDNSNSSSTSVVVAGYHISLGADASGPRGGATSAWIHAGAGAQSDGQASLDASGTDEGAAWSRELEPAGVHETHETGALGTALGRTETDSQERQGK